jgi:hypothetical protein
MLPKNVKAGKTRGNARVEALAIPLIVVLVGLAAFGLGRLSSSHAGESKLIIHTENEASTTPVSTL